MLMGHPYNGLKADIWSAGVILYAMCFGYLPFDSANTKELYQSIKEGRYDLPEHASGELRSLLGMILETDP
jgi:serine/threonine protein kinase